MRELDCVDDWLPKGARTRKTFVVLVLAICALLAAIRWGILPHLFDVSGGDPGEVVDELIGDFIATALAGTTLALLLRWIFPPPDRPPIVENLPAHEIGGRLEEALASTRQWWFDGSTGRYQRSTVLPKLAELGRKSGVSREVKIVILDPTDEDLCRHYGNYRGRVASPKKTFSVDQIRVDIYATILAAAEFNEGHPLDVTVALKRTMSILRYDMGDHQLVITKEGRTDPAIACPDNSFYYDAFHEQLRMSRKQAKELDLRKVEIPTSGFDRDSARAALGQLEIATGILDQDDAVDEILAKAASRQSPYR